MIAQTGIRVPSTQPDQGGRNSEITVQSVLEIKSLTSRSSPRLQANDFGTVEIETTRPIFFDPYRHNRQTGSFILIDPAANNTVAAGMIVGAAEGLAKSREQHRRMLVGVERDHSVLTLLKQLTPREDLALLSTWNAKAVDLLSD